MARPSKQEWTKVSNNLESTNITGEVDGESFTFSKLRLRPATDKEKADKVKPTATLDEIFTAVKFKNDASKVKAALLGVNKMRASKARAAAKVAASD